uniref:ATP synthase subunit b n=1 Tax=Tetranychus cinnabarinus TaxID=93129 RepID=A0A059UM38_TETCI|nr:putative ATP synthase B chain [Tetranychus cinnabarinus]
MFVRFAFASGSALAKASKTGLSQQAFNNIRCLTTKTIGVFGNELKEVDVECEVTPFKSHLTPSTQEKIYPTVLDNYEDIPVIVDGREVRVTRDDCCPAYPLIPNLAPPNAKPGETVKEIPKGVNMAEILEVNFAENMPTIDDDKNPQRDLVNFPADYQKLQVEAPVYRMFFFPSWWFDPFYNKTGVTGPYIAVTGITMAALSKEWLVIDHSVPGGIAFWIILFQALQKFGPKLKDQSVAAFLKTMRGWADWKEGSVKLLNNIIEFNNKEIQVGKDPSPLFNVYRENVHLQREAEYRKQLMAVYKEAKRKLDLQAALDEGKKQFARRYMVNWIIENVNKSVTPEKEKNILDECIVDLKNLSVKRANFI